MTETVLTIRSALHASTVTSRLSATTASVWALLREWRRRRRSRAELSSYTFAERSDFGYAADAEIAKPFWRK